MAKMKLLSSRTQRWTNLCSMNHSSIREPASQSIFDSFLKAFSLKLPDIATAQEENLVINGYLLNNHQRFELQNYDGNDLICCRGAWDGQWKILLPAVLIELLTINWYHALMAHGGSLHVCHSIGDSF
jgi:hypothetical protein